MIAQIFIPKIGRFDFVTEKDVILMHHIIKELPFNLPTLMIKVMQNAASCIKPALLYGMYLTIIFKEFGISLEGEPLRKLQHFDTYNEKSLR